MATTPRRSGTRRSLSAPAATVVSGFTSGKKEGAAPSLWTTRVAIDEPVRKLFFGLKADRRVDRASSPERIEDAGADPLENVETLRVQVRRRRPLRAELAGRVVAQLFDQERAARAGRTGDHLRRRQHHSQRAVAVLQLPDAERHHRDPEFA